MPGFRLLIPTPKIEIMGAGPSKPNASATQQVNMSAMSVNVPKMNASKNAAMNAVNAPKNAAMNAVNAPKNAVVGGKRKKTRRN